MAALSKTYSASAFLPGSAPLTGFIGGVICTQFVNSALHIAQPLLIAELTGSMGHAAFFSSFDTAVHTCGTFLAGWPSDRFGARRVLILATLLRGLALSAIPLAMIAGTPSLLWVMGWYTVDAFVRGFVDTAVYTLPLELGQHHAAELDRLNSRYELAFDLGGIAGPLALGGLMAWAHGAAPHAMIPAGFLLSSLVFLWIPQKERRLRAIEHNENKRSGSWEGARAIFRSPALLWTCLTYMSFNIYPLRKLLSAFFAKSLLGHPAAAGVLGAAFGAGGLVGTLAFARWNEKFSLSKWILSGAVGILLLAFGWLPASLAFMCISAFFFALSNASVRLALTRTRQQLTPLPLAGGVTSVSRFSANLVSVGLKSLVGAAFALGASPFTAFALVGASLGALALGQFRLASILPNALPESIAEKTESSTPSLASAAEQQ